MDRIYDAYNGSMGAEFMHKTRERLHWICSQIWGSCVLDVGCSQGVAPLLMARMGYAVDGLDVNPEAIAFASEQLAKEPEEIRGKVTYAVADFGKFVAAKDRKYDVITMSEVLEHLVRPQDFIRKAFTILPEKGRFIVTVPFGINDDPDHRQTFYLTSIYSMLHPFFEVAGVKIFDGWIGLVGRRRAEETKEPPVIPLNLMRQAEEAFFKIERPLRDGTLAVRNQRQALKAEQEKLAEHLRAAEQARLEAEAKAAAAEALPVRAELADVRGQLSASEGEVHALQTSLEVERKVSTGLQDQINLLKAALQFATSRQQDNLQESRLLEYSQEVRDLRTTLDQKRDEAVARAEEIGRLAGRAELVEEKNKRLTLERDALQSSCEGLESEVADLRSQIQESEEVHKKELEALNASAGTAAAEAESHIAELRAKYEEVRTALGNEKSWTERHQVEFEDYRSAVASEREKMSAALEESDKKISELTTSLEEAKALAAKMEENGKAAEKMRQQLESTVAELETKCAALSSELSAERSWSLKHKQECECYQKQCQSEKKTAEATIAKLQRTISQISKELDRVSNAYTKLSRAKLGRLTLAYWKFKDARK